MSADVVTLPVIRIERARYNEDQIIFLAPTETVGQPDNCVPLFSREQLAEANRRAMRRQLRVLDGVE